MIYRNSKKVQKKIDGLGITFARTWVVVSVQGILPSAGAGVKDQGCQELYQILKEKFNPNPTYLVARAWQDLVQLLVSQRSISLVDIFLPTTSLI